MTFTVATTYPLAVQRTRTYHRFTESEQLVESVKELDPDQPIVMLRKSDAQLAGGLRPQAKAFALSLQIHKRERLNLH